MLSLEKEDKKFYINIQQYDRRAVSWIVRMYTDVTDSVRTIKHRYRLRVQHTNQFAVHCDSIPAT